MLGAQRALGRHLGLLGSLVVNGIIGVYWECWGLLGSLGYGGH